MLPQTPQQRRLSRSPSKPRKTPPTPKPKLTRKPSTAITGLTSFNDLMRLRGRRLQEYVDCPRSNYRRLAADLCELIAPEEAMCLHPCNAEARIAFAKIVQGELARFGIPILAPHCWVTITPGSFAFPIDAAQGFKPHRLIQTIRQALGNIPFLAIIEAGHYRSSPHLRSPLVLGKDLKVRRSDMVSWHVHLVTWGFSSDRVRAALRPFRRRHSDMMGRDCVHVVGIEPDAAAHKLLYASKGQVKSYRHYLTSDFDVDSETGEITRKVRQSKDWMRTGDHVRMIEVFGRMRIDELVFGGGEGCVLANVIRYRAMLRFCRWAAKEIEAGREDASDYSFVASYRRLANGLRREHGDDILGDKPFWLEERFGYTRRRRTVDSNRRKRF